MITKYYAISNATNDHWYTENHATDMANRWSPSITDAFKFPSYEAAVNEIALDTFPLANFKITELIIKDAV